VRIFALLASLKPIACAGILVLALASSALAQELKPFPDTSRLVSIGGSLTEIIYALGEENRLAARDSTAVYPDAALKLPDVGYMRQLSPEGVLSVRPSALQVLEGSGPQEALDVLSKASIPYAVVPKGFSRAGILTKIRLVGEALGVSDKAAGLATKIDAQLKAAEDATKDIAAKRRVLFILSLQNGKLMASGTGTAANGIIAMAGAQNAVTEYPGYKALTDEAIINAKPDVILLMDRGGPSVSDDELFAQPGITLTPAGQNHKIVRMDGAYLLGFGPRTAAAVTDLTAAIYGDPAKHP
jgi:iron complex transport system substrate-binding protein